MRIALISDPWISTPPKFYGGIERVVYDLAREYVRRGNEVTLFGGPGSISPGHLVLYGKNCDSVEKVEAIKTSLLLSWDLMLNEERFDVIHNFGRLANLLFLIRADVPKVNTYMREINDRNIKTYSMIGARNLIYTGVSDYICRGGKKGGGVWRTVYNCTEVRQYHFQKDTDPKSSPLAFLGRIERCKGAHLAIEVARRARRKLIIAGNLSKLKHEIVYFEQEIKPKIDYKNVEYIGVVNNEDKNKLLGSVAALLMPIIWEEPFPVVLPESFSCGTPVLAFARGGMPEGIEQGKTGFLSHDVDEMVSHVGQLAEINRVDCRKEAEKRFSAEAVAEAYLRVYKEAGAFE